MKTWTISVFSMWRSGRIYLNGIGCGRIDKEVVSIWNSTLMIRPRGYLPDPFRNGFSKKVKECIVQYVRMQEGFWDARDLHGLNRRSSRSGAPDR